MATDMKRFMLAITPDMEASIELLKQESFYNKPYSELYRHLLTLGLEVEKSRATLRAGEASAPYKGGAYPIMKGEEV